MTRKSIRNKVDLNIVSDLLVPGDYIYCFAGAQVAHDSVYVKEGIDWGRAGFTANNGSYLEVPNQLFSKPFVLSYIGDNIEFKLISDSDHYIVMDEHL